MDQQRIDRDCRNRFAELLRHFCGGRISNFDFDDMALEIVYDCRERGFGDRAIENIYHEVWMLYSDNETQHFRNENRLPKETKRNIARCILFLYSDFQYEWQDWQMDISWWRYGWFWGLLELFERLMGVRRRPLPASERDEFGEECVWPFFRHNDFKLASRRPKLLTGHSRSKE